MRKMRVDLLARMKHSLHRPGHAAETPPWRISVSLLFFFLSFSLLGPQLLLCSRELHQQGGDGTKSYIFLRRYIQSLPLPSGSLGRRVHTWAVTSITSFSQTPETRGPRMLFGMGDYGCSQVGQAEPGEDPGWSRWIRCVREVW